MVQNFPWKDDCYSVGQEIPYFYGTQTIHTDSQQTNIWPYPEQVKLIPRPFLTLLSNLGIDVP
jgi:hypothetical protein